MDDVPDKDTGMLWLLDMHHNERGRPVTWGIGGGVIASVIGAYLGVANTAFGLPATNVWWLQLGLAVLGALVTVALFLADHQAAAAIDKSVTGGRALYPHGKSPFHNRDMGYGTVSYLVWGAMIITFFAFVGMIVNKFVPISTLLPHR